MMLDSMYMRRALALARRGRGCVAPNPMVGAIIVSDGKIVGRGWHQKAGGRHAEIAAIEQAGSRAKGAVLYITLEPCNHFGKTPPCTEAIANSGIRRVVVAHRDPNPEVCGGGVDRLREAGIEVRVGVLESVARELNAGWLFSVERGAPYVVLKAALSLDGKISSGPGIRTYLSCAASRAHVHRLRREADGLMVGVETVLADDPLLTNRSGLGRQPLKIIVDSRLRIGPDARVFLPHRDKFGENPARVLIATTSSADRAKRDLLEKRGAEIVELDGAGGQVDLRSLMHVFRERALVSVLCEGGARLARSLIVAGCCQRLVLYHAPKFIGEQGLALFPGSFWTESRSPSRIVLRKAKRIGRDVLSVYDVVNC